MAVRPKIEVPTSISPEALSKAMQEMDVSGVPPERMAQARLAHFMRVMMHASTPRDRRRVADAWADALAQAAEEALNRTSTRLILPR